MEQQYNVPRHTNSFSLPTALYNISKIGGDFFHITSLGRFYLWHYIIELYYVHPSTYTALTKVFIPHKLHLL